MKINNSGFYSNLVNSSQKNIDLYSKQLATSKRINSAADDAAGLSIATRLKSQVSSFNVGAANSEKVSTVLKSVEGTMGEAQKLLQKMRDVALQADNGTLSTSEKTDLQNQFKDLADSYDKLVSNSKVGGVNYLDGSVTSPVTVNTGVGSFSFDGADIKGGGAGGVADLSTLDVSTGAQAAITALDTSIDKVVSARGTYGAKINALDSITEVAKNQEVIAEEARGRIEDADMAKASSELTKAQIMQQANIAMLQNVNQANYNILSLFK